MVSSQPAKQAEPSEPGAIVEALVRVLAPQGAFAEELKRAGIDVKALQMSYPAGQFIRFLEICAREAYPALPMDQGIRKLAKRFLEGFRQTILGSVLMAGALIAGPSAAVKRFQKSLASGRPDLKVEFSELGSADFRIAVRGGQISGDFTAGVLEGLIERAKGIPQVELEKKVDGFDVRVRWTKA